MKAKNIKKLEEKLATIQREINELKKGKYEGKTCYDDCKDDCMHGVSDRDYYICHNASCRNHAGDCATHYLSCKKALGKKSDQDRINIVNKCCGFTRKGMPCKCPCK